MLNKLSIKKNFLILVVVTALAFAAVFALASLVMTSAKSQWQNYQHEVVQRESLLFEMKSQFGYGGLIHNFKNYVLRGTNKYHDRIQQHYQALSASIEAYRALNQLSEEEVRALEQVAHVGRLYYEYGDTIKERLAQGATPEQIDQIVKIDDSPAIEGFSLLQQSAAALTQAASKQLDDTIKNAMLSLFIGLGVAFLLIMGGIFAVSSNILKPINRLQVVMKDIAEGEGDLTRRLDDSGRNEMAELAHSFNKFVTKVQSLLGHVARSAEDLSSSTSRAAGVAERAKQGAQQQQSQTSHIASAIIEMNNTVQDVAQNTAHAAEVACQANDDAASGKQVVTQSLNVINALAADVQTAAEVLRKLEEHSANIGSVLDVIRGVAEQTNLLALNAAIEAARAGEQGRGFAVVADEVRTLASRTQESTQEIQSMIEHLQSGVNDAVKVMERGTDQASSSVAQAVKAGESLDAITQGVGSISDMNTQVATAAEELSALMEEIQRNATEINEVTGETAQGATEAASASEEQMRMSQSLSSLVSQFRI